MTIPTPRTACSGASRRSGAYARQPGMGDPRFELGDGVRSFAAGSYVVFYRPEADGILILLVAHGARDIPNVFRDRFRPRA